MKISLFIPCFVDHLYPQVGIATARVFEALGHSVDFPLRQTCCGQPAFNTGYWDEARHVAAKFVEVFAHAEVIVAPSGSCVAMVKRMYPELFQGTPQAATAASLAERTFEFSEFLVRNLRLTDVGASFKGRVTFHDGCHTLRELGVRDEPRQLLRAVRGLELVEMKEVVCCGFGGTFSVKSPEVSAAMGETKAALVEETGADCVSSCDPSCLMQIGSVLKRRGSGVRALHLAEILAARE